MKKDYSESNLVSNDKENIFAYITSEDETVQSAVLSRDSTYNVGADLELWIESITDYVLRNIRICRKYICAETAKEYLLTYECSDGCVIAVWAILENGQRVSMLAEDISSEEVSEDDRDDYKEIMYASDIVWPEFCQFVEKEYVKTVIDCVRLKLVEELGSDVMCEEKK